VVRLAPLYDVVSALPYPSLSPHKIKLAMRIGREYLVKKIGPRQWERLALDVRISPDDVRSRVTRITEGVAEVVHGVCQDAERAGLNHPIVQRFEETVATRAAACTRALSAGTSAPD
jgi:serine/threonine-protein kinase HipA